MQTGLDALATVVEWMEVIKQPAHHQSDLKFRIGDQVYKWTGDYGGIGTVRGIAINNKGEYRYMVSHMIEDGFGEFIHIYAENQLRVPS